jgi:hypothetical protein
MIHRYCKAAQLHDDQPGNSAEQKQQYPSGPVQEAENGSEQVPQSYNGQQNAQSHVEHKIAHVEKWGLPEPNWLNSGGVTGRRRCIILGLFIIKAQV